MITGGFWLNFENIYEYLSGDCDVLYMYSDMAGTYLGDVAGFETLALMSYMGLVVYGWDYDYVLLSGIRRELGYVLDGNNCYNYLGGRGGGGWQSYCRVVSSSSRVDLVGVLDANNYILEGTDTCWVLSLDLMRGFQMCGAAFVEAKDCDWCSSGGSYLDLTCMDESDEDVSMVYLSMVWDHGHRYRCYGRGFTFWVFDFCALVFNRDWRYEGEFEDKKGMFKYLLNFNKVFLRDAFCYAAERYGEGYMIWMRETFTGVLFE